MAYIARYAVLIFLSFCLAGCGKTYIVSVDSISEQGGIAKGNYYVVPYDDNCPDDLRFRRFTERVAVALQNSEATIVEEKPAASFLLKIAYWRGEPQTYLYETIRTHSQTVWVGHGKHAHYETFFYDVPEIRSYTVFPSGLKMDAYELKKGIQGKQVWQTEILSSDTNGDYEKVLESILRVLPSVAGRNVNGKWRVGYDRHGILDELQQVE